MKNINKLIVKINSLIPESIGTRPFHFGSKTLEMELKEKKLEQNKLITSLKWLDFKKWKYTIRELKEGTG